MEINQPVTVTSVSSTTDANGETLNIGLAVAPDASNPNPMPAIGSVYNVTIKSPTAAQKSLYTYGAAFSLNLVQASSNTGATGPTGPTGSTGATS